MIDQTGTVDRKPDSHCGKSVVYDSNKQICTRLFCAKQPWRTSHCRTHNNSIHAVFRWIFFAVLGQWILRMIAAKLLCCKLHIFSDAFQKIDTNVIFYRAMHYSAKRGLAITCRLSVCPSVMLMVDQAAGRLSLGGLGEQSPTFFKVGGIEGMVISLSFSTNFFAWIVRRLSSLVCYNFMIAFCHPYCVCLLLHVCLIRQCVK